MEIYLVKTMEWLNSGDSKTLLRKNYFLHCHLCLTTSGRKAWQGGGGNKKRYCTDSSRIIVFLRALQGQSGRNHTDPALQDNVIIPDGFFKYIYHVGCAVSLHSTNSWLIPGGLNWSKRQTVFFKSVDPMKKEHRSEQNNWLGSAAFCMVPSESGKYIKTRCIGSIHNLLNRKD